MDQFDADILRKLNGQKYWDIEELWEGWQLNIATMERFDSEEWIEIRLNGIGPNGLSTAQTPTIVQGDWFSPHKHCEPWQKYFIVDSDDVRPRWRERCLQQIGFLMYENTSHTDFYISEKRSPCELKLATKGRIALAQSAVTTQPDQGRMPEPQIRDKDDVQVVSATTGDQVTKPKADQIVVLWPGAEHTPYNIRIARSRTAILESGGNVKEAHKLLSREGNGIALATLYGHIKILNKEDRGWNSGIISKQLGNLENGVSPRTKGKQRGS